MPSTKFTPVSSHYSTSSKTIGGFYKDLTPGQMMRASVAQATPGEFRLAVAAVSPETRLYRQAIETSAAEELSAAETASLAAPEKIVDETAAAANACAEASRSSKRIVAHDEACDGSQSQPSMQQKKLSEIAPPTFESLISRGMVVPDEAAGPYDLDSYHANVTRAHRGYKERAGHHAWKAENETVMATQTGWDDINFQGLDPDYMFVYGRINGKGVDMQLLRPKVIAAQAAMRQQYNAAYVSARNRPGAAATFDRISALEDKRGKVAQPAGMALDILGLFSGALAAVGALWDFGEELVAASGDVNAVLSWGIKTARRIWFKLATKYDGDFSKVTDCARISIVFMKVSAMEHAARAVLERAATFKNRVKEPTPEGYRDLMFTIAMPNGHVCEVQLHLREMMAVKKSGAGHRMYKVCRRVLANPIVECDTYCLEVKDGAPSGEGARNGKGEREGRSTMVYASGDMYDGEWRAGVKEGQGTYYEAIGNKYAGEFNADVKEGQGTYYEAIGDKYVGQFNAGVKEGHGTHYYAASGDKYVGQWKGNVQHGRGTFYVADGRVKVGCYSDGNDAGEAVGWSPDRKVAWRFQDGQRIGEISLDEAAAIATCVGLPMPGAKV